MENPFRWSVLGLAVVFLVIAFGMWEYQVQVSPANH